MDWLTNEVRALMASGFSGALIRTCLRPEKSWKAWLTQMGAGLLSAIFIGQIVGHLLSHLIESTMNFSPGDSVFYATGYIIGTEAERFIRILQNRAAAAAGERQQENE